MEGLHWREIPERGSRHGTLFLVWMFRHFGSHVFHACLFPVLGFYLATHRVARLASRDYLQRLARLIRAPKPLSVFQHFRSFAISMLERVLAWRGQLGVPIDVRQIEEMFSAAHETGGVIISAHFGNTDLFRGLPLDSVQKRLIVLTIQENARRYQRLLGTNQDRWFEQYVEATDVTPALGMRLAAEIQQGRFVALAGDRLPSAQGAFFELEFLGSPTRFPRGPFVLASALQCHVCFMVCVRETTGYRFCVKPLQQGQDSPANRENKARELARAFVHELERLCVLHPYQWYNFFPFWQQTGKQANCKPLT